jgi:PAS domain S-box-containing protein
MSWLKLFIKCCLIILISFSNFQIATADQLNFTKREKTWLSQHHTVRARVGGAPPLHFYDGKFRGISVEYLNLIAERAGFKVQYIADIPWSTALENIKNHQELDLILTAKNTSERQKTMVFTEDYLLMAYAIFCRKDTDFIQTIENLENVKVSVEQDYVIHKKLLAEYPKIKLVIKKTSEEAIKAIALGEAEAYIGNLTMTSYIIQKNNLTNLKVTAPTPFEDHNQAMAIRDDWPELAGIINKTFGTFTQEVHKEILDKWSSTSVEIKNKKTISTEKNLQSQNTAINLTREERAWIKDHPILKITTEDMPPYTYIENGEPFGYSYELIKIMTKKLGLAIDLEINPMSETFRKIKSGEAILTLNKTHVKGFTDVLNFGIQPFQVKLGIFAKTGRNDISDLKSLKDKTYVGLKGNPLNQMIKQKVPKIKIIDSTSMFDSLQMISAGTADAAVMESNMGLFILRKYGLLDVRFVNFAEIFGKKGLRASYWASSKQHPELISILNKAFNTIDADQRQQLWNKWFQFEVFHPNTNKKLKLTESESIWLKIHPKIRVHNERNWPPFNYNLNDKPTGLSIDYMNILVDRIGIEVEYITGEWGELLDMTFNKKLDVMLNIVSTPERREHLLYTGSYMKNPNVIVAKETSNISGIESLFGKRVSFPSGFFYEELLKTQYPQIKRIPVKDLLASLKEVEFGRADAALGELAVVNYLIRENHLSNLVAKHEFSTGNPEIEKLNIAVRNDWPELQSILTKAMASVSEEEIQTLKNKWLHQTDYNKFENQEFQPGISIWRLIAYGLGIFLFVSLSFWMMIRFIKKEHISIKYGSIWFRLLVLAGLSIFLVVVFVIGWINLERSREMHLEDESRFLTGVLSVFQDRLDLWLTERKSFMKQLGANPNLVAITKRLLKVVPEKKALLASNELQEMRSFFKKSDGIFPNIGFFIIDPEYISIGSRRDGNVGTINLISKEYPDLLKKAFEGEVGFVPPIASDVHLGTSKGEKKPPTMFFIGPIRDVDGEVISVFTLRVDPWRDFSKAISSFEGFKSSEIYTFDEDGYLLTPSRFDQQLRSIGLLAEDQGSALNIEIRDPGVNLLEGKSPKQERSKQPLTHLVLRTLALKKQMEEMKTLASHSKIETDTTGYRDYRGVPVFGAWLWNAHLKIGLAAEVNLDEALSDYTTTRFMVITILGFTLFLSVGAVLLVLVLGERASRTLTKARDNLENEVEKRTSELQKNQDQLKTADERSRLLLNSAGEGIFGVDTAGKINFVNPSALNLLGYSENEMLGKGAHQLIHHSHGDGTHYDSTECPMYHSFTYGKSGKVTDEVLWCKNGTQFDVEYSSTPIKKDNEIIGAVITFLDVTERKKAEEKVRKSEELLNRALKLAKMGGWEYSVDGGLFWTQEVYDIHGIKPGMIEKEPDRDWIGDSINCYQKKDAERINDAFSKALSKGIPYDLTLRFKPWNGEEIWVRTTGEPMLKDGKIVRVIGLLADIDVQKKMEEALIAEKSHLQKVLDTSPVGVAISVGGIMRFANPKILELLDLKLNDPAPQFYVNTDDRDHIMTTLKSHGIIEGFELQMFGKNEEIKDMLVSYMTITYEGQGAILGWVMDITNLKKTDRELRQQFDEMSRFRKLAVGREIKMVDIKKEINDLLDQVGKEPKYKIVK